MPMRFRFRGLASTALLLFFCAAAPVARAGDLRFTWDPSTGATGYRLHYGTSSGQYTTTVDVGNVTQSTLNNLTNCANQFYAVTAYNSAGSSAYSTEVASWPRPILTSASPSTGQRGTQLALTLTGSNYQSGATVSFSGSGITVNSVSVASCTQLTVNITISATATLGASTITVRSANGVAGTGSSLLFSVVSQTLPAVQNLRRTDVQ